MAVRGVHAVRGRLVAGVTVLVVAAAGLFGVSTSSYFTDTDAVTGNTFTTGSIDLTASPATNAITLAGMVPGDKVTGAFTVTNTGSLPLRYAVDSVTTEDALAAQLELTIKTDVSACTTPGFATDGDAVYSADLGSTGGAKLIGDPAPGNQAGDRTLAAGAGEVLCAQVVLPITTDNTFQATTTTATLTFNAEHATAAPVLAGALAGTTVPASWTAVPGATSYTLTRVATTAGTAAQLNAPFGVAVAADDTVYVADTSNNRIRKVTAAGAVSTLAGSTSGFADGAGAAAKFDQPYGVAVGADGTVYVADFFNNRIRKVTPAGDVTTLAGSGASGVADGIGPAAQFNYPIGVAVAADGAVYVAEYGNHRIRKVTAAGVVTTLAGSTLGFADGAGTAAQFNYPRSVAVAADGAVYVADYSNHRIRKVTAAGVVSTLAGSTSGSADGAGAAAQFSSPRGVAVAADGAVYVADWSNHRIRKVTASGVVSTLAGSTSGSADGAGAAAKFANPAGVAVGADGAVYVGDTNNHRIRKVTTAGVVTTLAGSTFGFAESGPPVVVASVVYTGTALSFTDTTLVAGTSYTYTVTAVGPETVSNTLGPFVP